MKLCIINNEIGKRLLAHLSRRLIGIAYSIPVEPASVRACVRPFTLSNMNISATSWPIGMKFYLKHHWSGGKASVGFEIELELWFPWQQIAPIEL